MKIPAFSFFFLVILCSCSVTERNISGSYHLKTASRSSLVLHANKTFEFVKNFAEPGPAFFPDSTELNFRTSGNWILKYKHQLILNSFSKADTSFTEMAKDSITRNTDITSFSFWDQYGDPVPIRLIHFPANRIKLHRSNSISFFAQDFKETDTIEFHFYGYMPYRWLAKTGEAMTNQQHIITLFEQYRHGYFRDVTLVAERNKLSSPDKSFSIYKSK